MDPELLAKLERLALSGVSLLPVSQLPRHFVFERDGMAVIVERRGEGFGGVGSPGRVTAKGFEALVESGGEHWFVFKEEREAATGGDVESARRLLRDLKSALH